MNGAGVLIEVLIEQGTDTIFGYPGGFVMNIYDELYKNCHRIRHITTCHEQAAAHAADAYARVSGKVGVCMATSGPGATNLVTGIATAYLDSTPLVAITGNVPGAMKGRDSFQEVDIMGITMPVTKHNYVVHEPAKLADTVREAFYVARSGRPGPVLIDIPKDIQMADCEYKPKEIRPVTYAQPSSDAFTEAAELIAGCRRPAIYAGGGVVSSRAEAELLQFAERISAPVVTSMMGMTGFPSDHELNFGMVGMHGHYAANRIMAECDLLIAVGVRFSDRATGDKNEFVRNKRILHIDIDPAEIGKNIPACTDVIGNAKDILKVLLPMLPPKVDAQWYAQVKSIRENPADGTLQPGRLTPRMVIEAVRGRMPEDGIVATDVGQHQMWTAQFYKFRRPRTFVTSGGLGTMGFGMGASIGASVGSGNKRTALFTSDGSFHMNMTELATAVSFNIPLVVVMLNNNALGMVRQWQALFFDKRYSCTSLERKTDFVKAAEAFGARGLRVTRPDELAGALDRAFAETTPVLVDCHIDHDEKVLPMIPPGGSIKNIILR